MGADAAVRVVLAGNPNCGKTTLFNLLTGARRKVANYPGVTVEKREGTYWRDGCRYEVLDLPGTYSLTSYSAEERIACQELLRDGTTATVTVVVVEAAMLPRSLHLLAQVMQIQANPILCLNMWDEFERSGAGLDLEKLRRRLGIPVLTTVGSAGLGVEELRDAIAHAAQHPVGTDGRVRLGERLELALAAVAARLRQTSYDTPSLPWTAEKLLVADPAWVAPVARIGADGAGAVAAAAEWRQRLEREAGEDIALLVTRRYREFIEEALRDARHRPPRPDARAVSDRVDRLLVHRWLGLPLFLAIMYGLFWATFRLGEAPMGWIEEGIARASALISGFWPAGAESPLRSLLVDGILGGVGGVLVFLPNIVLLFLGLGLLEDTGYMARAAFLMDRFLHRFGLHGQSFIPLMSGFGCSVPGIMATRTLRNERDRLVTILVLPLMSCGARLPIWMLLIPAFFPASARAPALWLIYVTGVAVALVLAATLRRGWLGGEPSPFVLELPPYRVPTVRALGLQTVDRARVYARKAGTTILAISIVLWAASTWPKPRAGEFDGAATSGETAIVLVGTAPAPWIGAGAPPTPGPAAPAPEETEALSARRAAENLRASLVGRFGTLLEPVLRPMGFDWRLGAGLVGAFAAKEVFVAQMGVVYALGEPDGSSEGLRRALRENYPPAAGCALMLFLLIATPCMATVAVTRRETGGWKWAMAQFWGLTAIGYGFATLAYQVGRIL